MLKLFIAVMDRLLCAYLGLDRGRPCPVAVQMIKGKLFVQSILPYTRHLIVKRWSDFDADDIAQLPAEIRTKMGLAAGKAIAKNLVVKFD
jgi:hypothetical protein